MKKSTSLFERKERNIQLTENSSVHQGYAIRSINIDTYQLSLSYRARRNLVGERRYFRVANRVTKYLGKGEILDGRRCRVSKGGWFGLKQRRKGRKNGRNIAAKSK